MLLTVEVSEWELEERGRILCVGDRERFWLTFEEAERRAPAAERINVIRGVAVPLPPWPGAEFGWHAVRIDIEGGALYWDAPERTTGAIEVAGTISTNHVDAPEGFPETTGVLRRVRMVWDDFALSQERVWRSVGEGARYEEVTAFDPEVEAELRRTAGQAYDREMAARRLSPGESFELGLKVPSSNRNIPAGTTQTRWMGVLIDFDTADSGPE
jgi:hypothetical protein